MDSVKKDPGFEMTVRFFLLTIVALLLCSLSYTIDSVARQGHMKSCEF